MIAEGTRSHSEVVADSRPPTPGSAGSYGLQLVGEGDIARALSDAGHWMVRPDPSWPRWRVESALVPARTGDSEEWTDGAGAPRTDELTEDRARIATSTNGGWIDLDRHEQRTRFCMSEPLTAAALVHPLLTSTAAIAAHWFGRTPFHAGGFVVEGRAWGVLGGREMGKSSLLMGLHMTGVNIVSDDLMVVDEGRVYAGPRCLDLRQAAADRFGTGRPLGRVGRRDRWRVDLPSVPGDLPLSGWVVLGWSESFAIQPMAVSERLAALAMNRAVIARGTVPRKLLDAVAMPVFLFSRPRDWSRLGEGVERLLSALEGA